MGRGNIGVFFPSNSKINPPKFHRKAESTASESDEDDDLQEALAALQASGQSFLQSFEVNPFVQTSSNKTSKWTEAPPTQSLDDDGWSGIDESSAGDADLFVASLPKKSVVNKKTVGNRY